MAQPIDAVLADAARLTAAGQATAAIETLRPVIAEHPDHAGAWCGLAAAFLDVGEPQHCLDAAKRAITLGEPAWAHRLASLALTELGRHDEAAISARESARRSPDDWRGYVALAEALAPIAPADAMTAARRAVSMAPDEPRTHEVMGATAERAGETDAARAAYEESLRLDPSNPDVRTALGKLGRKRTGSRFGDVPWERATAWQEAVPEEPDWTLVDAEDGSGQRFTKRRKAKRPAGARSVRFTGTNGSDPADVFGQPPGDEDRDPVGSTTKRPKPEVRFERHRGSERDRTTARAKSNGFKQKPKRESPSRRLGRAERIGLWLVLRRCSGWLAVGAFVLIIAGMPVPTKLLAWFSLGLVVVVGGMAGVRVFKLPADIQLTPGYLWRHNKLMAVGAGILALGLGLLAIWTAALALGSTSMTLLTPVVLLGLLALAVGSFGLWRMRIRR